MTWNRERTLCTGSDGRRWYRHPGSGAMCELGLPDPPPKLALEYERRAAFVYSGPPLTKPAKPARAPKASADTATGDLFDGS